MTTNPLPLPTLAPLTPSSEPSLQHKHHHYSQFASWLIPSRILIGESPSPPDDRNATSHRIHSICHSAKCRTFVCLQAEVPPQTLDAMVVGGGYEDWREDKTKKVGPTYYYHVRKRLGVGAKVEYVHYGMRKQGGKCGDGRGERKGGMVRSMESLKEFIEELKRRVFQGEIMYLYGGGTNDERTSMVAAGLLGWLYPSMGVVEAVTRTGIYCGLQRKKLGFGGDGVGERDEFCPMKIFKIGGGDDGGKVGDLLSLREEEMVQENEENEKEEVVEVEISNLECMSSLSKEDILLDYSMSSLSSPTMRDDLMMEGNEEESVVFSVDELDGGQSVNYNDDNDNVKEEENTHEFKPEDIVANPIKHLDNNNGVCSGSLQERTKYQRNLSLATTATASSSSSQEIESNDEGRKFYTPAAPTRRGEEEEEKEDDATNQSAEYHLAGRPQQGTENNKFVVSIQQVRYSSTRVLEIKNKLRSMEYQYRRSIGV